LLNNEDEQVHVAGCTPGAKSGTYNCLVDAADVQHKVFTSNAENHLLDHHPGCLGKRLQPVLCHSLALSHNTQNVVANATGMNVKVDTLQP